MAGNLISISLGPGIFSLLWKCHISEHSPTRRAETGGNFGQLELPYTVIAQEHGTIPHSHSLSESLSKKTKPT